MDTLQSDVKAGATSWGPLGALSDIFLGSKSPLNAMVKRPTALSPSPSSFWWYGRYLATLHIFFLGLWVLGSSGP